jgi:hypothetical protein
MKLETFYKNLILRARTPQALTRRVFLLEKRDDLESRLELQRRSLLGRRHVGKYRQAIKTIDKMLKQCPEDSSDPLSEPIETLYQEWLAKAPDLKMLKEAEAYMARALKPEDR